MSACWLRMSRSASAGVATVAVMMKYSDCESRSTACCVRWSICEVTTTVRTFLTSVVMAKPKSSISTMGMPKRMSMVRRSRRICLASLMMKENNRPPKPSPREGCLVTFICLLSAICCFQRELLSKTSLPLGGLGWALVWVYSPRVACRARKVNTWSMSGWP